MILRIQLRELCTFSALDNGLYRDMDYFRNIARIILINGVKQLQLTLILLSSNLLDFIRTYFEEIHRLPMVSEASLVACGGLLLIECAYKGGPIFCSHIYLQYKSSFTQHIS